MIVESLRNLSNAILSKGKETFLSVESMKDYIVLRNFLLKRYDEYGADMCRKMEDAYEKEDF